MDGIGVTALRAILPEEEFQKVVDRTVERGGRIGYRTVPGHDPVPYELNVVYLDAVGGVEPFIASQAIALALQGVPAVYFNSVIGAHNWEEGVEQLGYNRAINRQKFQLDELTRELEAEDTTKHRVYAAYTGLLRARRAEPGSGLRAGQRPPRPAQLRDVARRPRHDPRPDVGGAAVDAGRLTVTDS